jgi:hypothetical protein
MRATDWNASTIGRTGPLTALIGPRLLLKTGSAHPRLVKGLAVSDNEAHA